MMSDAAQTLWLIRHGQRADVDPAWRPQRCQHTEVPLSPFGEAQAQAAAERLAAERTDYLFSSPYLRAVQTAVAISRRVHVPVRIERGVMEWQNPVWFPQRPPLEPSRALARRFPEIDRTYRSRLRPRWPETLEQMQARMARAAARLTAEFAGALVVVGHGATVTWIARALLGDPTAPVRAPLCGLVRLDRRDSGWTLTINGDVSHLERQGLCDLEH